MMWTRLYRGAMPAINLGKTGHIVIDLDRHEGGPDGIAAWEAISAGKELPEGLLAIGTPSGGRHLYFRQPEGRETLGNREGQLKGLGINVRGSGGYVVGAGAVRVDGTCYAFPGDLERYEALFNAPVIPRWLEDMIRGGEPENHETSSSVNSGDLPRNGDRPNRRDLAGLERELEDLRNAPKGSRNNQLNDTAFNVAQLAMAV